MAYVCDLGSGHRVYLDNQGTNTIITTHFHSPGQQQQASSSLVTGLWTAQPEAYQTPTGTVLKITTAQGTHFFQIQGSSVSSMAQSPSMGTAQQLQVQQTADMPSSAMPAMQPMQPIQFSSPQSMTPMQPMGNLQMSMNPMEMRMGNMEMRIGSTASVSQSTSTAQSATSKRFCTQCGAGVDPSDRFCASCGHALT